MGVVDRLINAVGAVALAVCLIGMGFIACVLPPTTHGIAMVHADDPSSPFDRTQLVEVADATRDYAFGSHDAQALYRAVFEVDKEYAEGLSSKGGKVERGFPDLDGVSADSSAEDFEAAFSGASDVYCYTPDVVGHLDECHAIAAAAYPLLALCALLAVAALALTGLWRHKGDVGAVLIAAGIGVLALFVLLGLWALVDFNGLFSSFHQLFFPDGNWTFPADSLLICALPTGFWSSIGAAWLIVSVIMSVVSIAVGFLLRRRP